MSTTNSPISSEFDPDSVITHWPLPIYTAAVVTLFLLGFVLDLAVEYAQQAYTRRPSSHSDIGCSKRKYSEWTMHALVGLVVGGVVALGVIHVEEMYRQVIRQFHIELGISPALKATIIMLVLVDTLSQLFALSRVWILSSRHVVWTTICATLVLLSCVAYAGTFVLTLQRHTLIWTGAIYKFGATYTWSNFCAYTVMSSLLAYLLSRETEWRCGRGRLLGICGLLIAAFVPTTTSALVEAIGSVLTGGRMVYSVVKMITPPISVVSVLYSANTDPLFASHDHHDAHGGPLTFAAKAVSHSHGNGTHSNLHAQTPDHAVHGLQGSTRQACAHQPPRAPCAICTRQRERQRQQQQKRGHGIGRAVYPPSPTTSGIVRNISVEIHVSEAEAEAEALSADGHSLHSSPSTSLKNTHIDVARMRHTSDYIAEEQEDIRSVHSAATTSKTAGSGKMSPGVFV